MIWRVVAPVLLRGFGLVALLVGGVVAMAVTFEQAPRGAEALMMFLQLHIGVSVVWLGPLICGLGVCLTGLRMDSRGELRALAVSGVGWTSTWPIVIFMGAVVAGIGLCVGEFWLPSASTLEAPLWIWTDAGPLRTIDGLHVQIESGGALSHRSVSASLLQRATPRRAPISVLHWSGTTSEVTEICARFARLPACMGFGLLGLWMGRLSRPLVAMVGTGAVLVVVEAIAWTMGAQGRLHPVLAGSVGAWLWCLPAVWTWAQPSTRIQRPV